ncbi:hypothetical protein DENSPDRAFT_885210 [Dentipellis sp. KUC8613]|nr:hypothetical protein DENSPDRAFT_885210 [Dentipellis sp. KUC8613]
MTTDAATHPQGSVGSLRKLLSPKEHLSVLSKESPSPAITVIPDNSSSETPPISRLPDDLLLLILESTKRATDTDTDTDTKAHLRLEAAPAGLVLRWLVLLLVCRRWHALIRNTYAFWRDISFCSYARAQLCLARSGGASIDVSYADSVEMCAAEKDSPDTLRLLMDNIGRTRSLWLAGPCVQRFMCEVAPSPGAAPVLEELQLQVCDLFDMPSAGYGILSDAFLTNPSRLHTIAISYVGVRPTSSVFAGNVTSLSLQSYNLPGVGWFTIPEMLAALQKMPRIETLSLSYMLRWGDDDGSSGSAGVHLPQLKTLRL